MDAKAKYRDSIPFRKRSARKAETLRRIVELDGARQLHVCRRGSVGVRVCVTGKSGSSKSLLMQELVAGLIGAGGEAVVIDDGWSFQHMGSEGDDDALDQAAPLAD